MPHRIKAARTAPKQIASSRADKLISKFSVPNYCYWIKPKSDFLQFVEKYAPEFSPTEAHDVISQAFERASLHLRYSRAGKTGPTIEERKLLAARIAQLSHQLLIALTGQIGSNRNLGAVQSSLFSAVDQLDVVQQALPQLATIQSAASQVLTLESATLGGATSKPRGRRTEDSLNILFSELMRSWVKLTGKRPQLTVSHIGEVTCPFCIFFHTSAVTIGDCGQGQLLIDVEDWLLLPTIQYQTP